MRRLVTCIFFLWSSLTVVAQNEGAIFHSSDTALQMAFDWAKQMALSYKGKPSDPVGPWYESALPPRSAFCMRDVSHQCTGGEILGLSKENKNMFTHFVKNISDSKNWCTYWEMNRLGNPAPEDYRNDTAFWYNLNANFDLMNACWRLYLWTGDTAYIKDPAFVYFFEKTVFNYIDGWKLQPGALLSRPAHPFAGSSYNEDDAFHRCRGLPSYSEGVPGLKMGIDLIASLYRAMETYAAILTVKGQKKRPLPFNKRQGNISNTSKTNGGMKKIGAIIPTLQTMAFLEKAKEKLFYCGLML
ncbi:MAG: hypothetical protein QM802_14335 [Agriterribacter sp.]